MQIEARDLPSRRVTARAHAPMRAGTDPALDVGQRGIIRWRTVLALQHRQGSLAMGNVALVRNLTLASLFVVPSCVTGVDSGADGDTDLDTDLAATEATLTSRTCPVETPAELAP